MGCTESVADSTALAHVECVTAAASDLFARALRQTLEPIDGLETGPASGGVIIATISLIGGVDWSVFLGFPCDTAVGIATAFAGFEVPFDSEEMGDAIGELTNIYAGLVKSRLDARGTKAEISLPNVVRGENVQFLSQSSTQCRKWAYNSGLGAFWAGVILPACGG